MQTIFAAEFKHQYSALIDRIDAERFDLSSLTNRLHG